VASETIGVVGLGYVGLPLAVAFARKGFAVVGFDIDARRIAALRDHRDWTGEVAEAHLREAALQLTSEPADLSGASVYIVTVPTPVDASNQPDMTLLLKACEAIGPRLAQGDVVVFESTVYPGATEEVCAPWSARPASPAARGSGSPTAPSASIRATPSIPWSASSRSSPPRTARRSTGSPASTDGSSRRASTGPPRSRSPKPPRSSRTRSATSTSR
jgi:hypothetical protein